MDERIWGREVCVYWERERERERKRERLKGDGGGEGGHVIKIIIDQRGGSRLSLRSLMIPKLYSPLKAQST